MKSVLFIRPISRASTSSPPKLQYAHTATLSHKHELTKLIGQFLFMRQNCRCDIGIKVSSFKSY